MLRWKRPEAIFVLLLCLLSASGLQAQQPAPARSTTAGDERRTAQPSVSSTPTPLPASRVTEPAATYPTATYPAATDPNAGRVQAPTSAPPGTVAAPGTPPPPPPHPTTGSLTTAAPSPTPPAPQPPPSLQPLPATRLQLPAPAESSPTWAPTEGVTPEPDGTSFDNYPQTPSAPMGVALPRANSGGGGVPTAPTLASTEDQGLPPLRQILVAADSIAAAEQQRQKLAALGLRVVARKQLKALGWVLSTYRVPDDVDMDSLLAQVSGEIPDAAVESNQRYRLLLSDKQSWAQRQVGVTPPSQCLRNVPVAMIDSGVNAALFAEQGDRIEVVDIVNATAAPEHGTAIASLLVSSQPAFPGLLPQARLLAINVFARDAAGEAETRTDWLLQAFDRLLAQSPAPLVVNLSFGGQHSWLLQAVIAEVSERMAVVAAAGNGGDESPVYPAAYPGVIAVGAVDASGRRARQSSFGTHVRVLAPGVDVWTRRGDGQGFYASGTSFAAPFATAALALARERGQTADEFIAALNSSLVSFVGLCP